MSKSVGYGKFCLIDKENKTASCGDIYNNIQTTCKPAKVFFAEDSQHIKLETKTPSSTNSDTIINSVRDPTIDYNYFRASRTQ